jgi:hypothetical protein
MVPAGFTASSDSASPARSSSTGFSLCGLSCGEFTVHRLMVRQRSPQEPVLLKADIRRNTIPRGKLAPDS